MRYIGGKTNLLHEIENVILKNTSNVKTIIDVFAGSGVVSSFFRERSFNIIGNDFLYFSYVLNRGTTGLNNVPEFKKLGIKNVIKYLNNLEIKDTDIKLKDCFIYQNYAPHDNVSRMYFQKENAIKIDIIRITIENWYNQKLIDDDEFYYLLAALISAVPYVSNIAGVYGAYLKHWDDRTYNKIVLKAPTIILNKSNAVFYNENYIDLLPNVSGDLLYADPPYNSRQYLPNYHVLETIARYDYPDIHGVTGMRNYAEQKSDFCVRRSVESAFKTLIESANVNYVIISYNNEGLLSTDKLTEICKNYAVEGTFSLSEIDYRRYNNANTSCGGVKEQLYFFKKKR